MREGRSNGTLAAAVSQLMARGGVLHYLQMVAEGNKKGQVDIRFCTIRVPASQFGYTFLAVNVSQN